MTHFFAHSNARSHGFYGWVLSLALPLALLLALLLIFISLQLLMCSSAQAEEVSKAVARPDCNRPFTLALHDHGLLYSAKTGEGIDKEIADEMSRRSGCKVIVSVLPRARIWQLIESGALDFSLSGISNAERDRFASFAWYFSNKYYLLVRKELNIQQLKDFENNPDLQLGVIRSFRYSPNANRLLDKLHAEQRVRYASDLDPLYQILEANRIQAMIIEPFDYSQVANTAIRDHTIVIDMDDSSVPHGLIMSKRSLSAKEQEKWRALIKGMREDGKVLTIFEKYFQPELAKAMVNF
ncbi:polar amino acid transport system substrate-binding protein [Undibacterium sp. GrIS 1.2]